MAKPDYSMVPSEYLNPTTGRFLPGHDAKYISDLLAEVKAEATAEGKKSISISKVREVQKSIPTPALREKFAKAVANWNERDAKKAARKADLGKPVEPGVKVAKDEPTADDENTIAADKVLRYTERPDIKVGRWFYPARDVYLVNGAQIVVRNTARDGSGDWIIVREA